MTKKKLILFSSIAVIVLAIALIFVILYFNDSNNKYKITFNNDNNKIDCILSIEDGRILYLPDNPIQDGFDFKGWFWDNNTWNKPLTAESLIEFDNKNQAGNVYAKFNEINFTYNVDDKKVEITGVIDNAITELVIPELISGYKVVGIKENAFSNCNNLNYNEKDNMLYLGNENIPYFAAIKLNIINIENICIHSTTKIIAKGAFYNCNSLISVSIPDEILNTHGIFKNCNTITTISVPLSDNKILGNYFDTSNSDIPTSLKSVVITNGETIPHNFFFDCSSLTSISIPDSIKNISDYAFSYCTSLTTISIPDSVTNIGKYAFSFCTSLSSISIPKNITNIEYGTFYHCLSLNSIFIPKNITYIAPCIFYECYALKEIIFEDASNWFYTSNYKNINVSGTKYDFSNSLINTNIFRIEYCRYYWFKTNP